MIKIIIINSLAILTSLLNYHINIVSKFLNYLTAYKRSISLSKSSDIQNSWDSMLNIKTLCQKKADYGANIWIIIDYILYKGSYLFNNKRYDFSNSL